LLSSVLPYSTTTPEGRSASKKVALAAAFGEG
jgi:hypothetical protein